VRRGEANANLPYDPVKDFSPVILLAKLPLIMTVTASLPAQSVADVIALANARPGQLTFASSGSGGAPHLAGELFKTLTAIDLLHVPYRGSGPAVLDLIAGRIAIMFDAAPSLLPFITSGTLRPLAAASQERHRLLPDVPSFAELGYPRMDISLWYGIVAPAATPQPIVQRLNAELVNSGNARHPQELRRTRRRHQRRHARMVRCVHARRIRPLGRGDETGRHKTGMTGQLPADVIRPWNMEGSPPHLWSPPMRSSL
jgi:tripartite-type tricarboxylate transporter receptor subunit TctC